MPDVCIFYSRKDKLSASLLYSVLSPRWSVWWDGEITGDFRIEIEAAIASAKCAIPVWSSDSRKSSIVLDEATLATKQGLQLLPVTFEPGIDPPLGFGNVDIVDLSGWTGDLIHPGIKRLITKLHSVVPAPIPGTQRPRATTIGSTKLQHPTFFFSISSHETQLNPADAVQALALVKAETILVSAYDIVRRQKNGKPMRARGEPKVSRPMISALKKAQAMGTTILIDSGNYEASRRADKDWQYTDLHNVLAAAPHDLAFCYDKIDPPPSADSMARSVITAVERDSRHTKKPILPIVHAPRLKTGQYDTTNLPAVLRKVADRLKPSVLAIPERELGSGIIERAKTLHIIRQELDKLSHYQPLHILGTGNPLSMAVLAAAGADSFDGLEWCRVVADAESCLLYHFQHYDFFAYQTTLAQSSMVREAIQSKDINFAGKVIFHNFDFFNQFIQNLREAVSEDRLPRFLSERLPKGSMAQLEQALPTVF